MSSTVSLLVAFGLVATLARAQQVNPDESGLTSMSLEQLLDVRVETATLRKQSLQDAPASVTVITAAHIRRYGYRTLAEVLSNVRSFYVSSDGPFQFAGARGFSLLGDINTRFLVLINGHHLTDNVYGAMYYFGRDFPLDLELVDQIEIVRGPSSALYGSNGLLATINVITKTPSNAPRERASTTVGSFGETNVMASSTFGVGPNAKVLISAQGSYTGGRNVELTEGNSPGTMLRTDHAGADRSYRMFAAVTWKNWSFHGLFGEFKAIAPTGWYKAEIGNTGTSDLESRNFFEAAWHRKTGRTGALRWRMYYDQYRYDGVYDYGEGNRNYDGAIGDWAGTQLVYDREFSSGVLTLGGEANFDLRNLQYNYGVVTSGGVSERNDVFRMSHRRSGVGFFAQEKLKLSRGWTAYLGGRIDDTSADRMFISPRVALVYGGKSSTYKFMYGRAFRNPSTFERYWEPNPNLDAERINTFEITREQKLHRRANLISSVFHYRLGGMILGVPVRPDALQYRNAAKASATGFEVEVNGRPAPWLDLASSFSIQRTRGGLSDMALGNSPARLGQIRASVPLAAHRLLLGGAVRHVSSRLSAEDNRVPGYMLLDLTLTTARRLHSRAEWQFGVRNLLDRAYSDPLSPEHATPLLRAAGRSFFVRLSWSHE
jgi:iron complex outermembrane receptor protein